MVSVRDGWLGSEIEILHQKVRLQSGGSVSRTIVAEACSFRFT